MPFRGGLDQETPPWELPPGMLREAENYEQGITGGYVDVTGYERFDGSPAPSEQSYAIMEVSISGSIVAGDTITGGTSTETAEVLAVVTTTTPNYLVITKDTGAFTATEDLDVSAVTEGTVTTTQVADGASTNKLNAQYTNLAADEYRADIAVVPGEGSIQGVWMLNDVVYAFRNAVGGSIGRMYKSTASGWSQVLPNEEVEFDSGGTYEIVGGNIITGATSTQTATVERVILTSGTWAGGDAAGKLVVSGKSGSFTADEQLDVGANLNVADMVGQFTTTFMPADADYYFYNSNFANPGGAERMYGVNGQGRGFEYDGSVFVWIDTGMTTDKPQHVIVHRQHLFYAFGSNLQHSGIGDPYTWTITSGASALVCDEQITGFDRQPGAQGSAALGVFQDNRVHILYGTSTSDWDLIPYRDEVGAYPGTIAQMGFSMFLDAQGITSLRTAQEFGNFQHATFSRKIQNLITGKRQLATSSCIVRAKNQYRLFFSDNTAIYVTMEGLKVAAMMPIQLSHPALKCCSIEHSDGQERIYFGGSTGMVYQMEKGTSFDGGDISAYMTTHYTNDALQWLKHYNNSLTIEARGTGYAEIEFAYELGYNAPDVPQPDQVTKEVSFGTDARWDDPGATWDTLFWDGRSLQPVTGLRLEGDGTNISFTIRKISDYFSPVRHTGIHYRYSLRRPLR